MPSPSGYERRSPTSLTVTLGGRSPLAPRRSSAQLETLLDQALAAERAGPPSDAVATYRAALPLWNGEPYLDGPDAEWVMTERSRLGARYVAAALRAGELLLADGDTDGAREAADRALVADRWCEPAHRLAIRAHLEAGDRAAAPGR